MTVAIQLEAHLRWSKVNWTTRARRRIGYVMNIGQKRFYDVAAKVSAGDLDELATGPPRIGTSIAKAGVRLLGISEHIEGASVTAEKLPQSRQC